MVTCSSSSIVRGIIFEKESDEHHHLSLSNLGNYTIVDYNEFEDSVYAVDWALNDPMTFAAVSYNSYIHINSIPEDIKYKIMLDN